MLCGLIIRHIIIEWQVRLSATTNRVVLPDAIEVTLCIIFVVAVILTLIH